MRIKRSHLESLHFVVGTLLSSLLILSISSNLQAHPITRLLNLQTSPQTNVDSSSPQPEAETSLACERSTEVEARGLPVEPEIATALEALRPEWTTAATVQVAMDEACVGPDASLALHESSEMGDLATLLATIESALHPVPEPNLCEDLARVFDIPSQFPARFLASTY